MFSSNMQGVASALDICDRECSDVRQVRKPRKVLPLLVSRSSVEDRDAHALFKVTCTHAVLSSVPSVRLSRVHSQML
jgi:hypothetical protein